MLKISMKRVWIMRHMTHNEQISFQVPRFHNLSLFPYCMCREPYHKLDQAVPRFLDTQTAHGVPAQISDVDDFDLMVIRRNTDQADLGLIKAHYSGAASATARFAGVGVSVISFRRTNHQKSWHAGMIRPNSSVSQPNECPDSFAGFISRFPMNMRLHDYQNGSTTAVHWSTKFWPIFRVAFSSSWHLIVTSSAFCGGRSATCNRSLRIIFKAALRHGAGYESWWSPEGWAWAWTPLLPEAASVEHSLNVAFT